jgi:integrase
MRKQPTPRNNNGSIALVFKLDGKEYKLTGYGQYSDKKAIALANSFASKLYGDYLSGNLKPLEEYQPKQSALVTLAVAEIKEITVLELYKQFVEYKAANLSEKTLERYKSFENTLERLKLTWDSLVVRTKLQSISQLQAKRLASTLSTMSAWGYQHKLINQNYFDDLAEDMPTGIKTPEPKPFTQFQRRIIIQAFANSDRYRYLADFVIFLFETGCRPCEAIGLQWNDVDFTKKQVNLGRSIVHLANGTKQERAVSKTGKLRVFPMNKMLNYVLTDRLPSDTYKYNLVFTGKEGYAINLNNFRNRAWKSILTELGIDPTIYTPYSTRDTFITLALEKKVDIRTIAKLCDNSPTIIYKHYAGWINEIAPINFE